MEYNRLIDRNAETDRITEALKRENTQFIVIYGRRRIGKSTLIKYLVSCFSSLARFSKRVLMDFPIFFVIVLSPNM